MKSRLANTSPSELKVRSGLLDLKPSERTTPRNASRADRRTDAPERSQRQTMPNGISLIGDIQERIRLIDSRGYEYKAKLTILKEAARTLNYLTENNLLQYADLERKVGDVHSSYERYVCAVNEVCGGTSRQQEEGLYLWSGIYKHDVQAVQNESGYSRHLCKPRRNGSEHIHQ